MLHVYRFEFVYPQGEYGHTQRPLMFMVKAKSPREALLQVLDRRPNVNHFAAVHIEVNEAEYIDTKEN